MGCVARRFHRDPAFAPPVDVFGKPEAKPADIEGDAGVIVLYDQRQGRDPAGFNSGCRAG
jgi:hypothetical protein